MKESYKERNTSIELLRIIAMIMIILHHYTVYSGVMKYGTNLNVVISCFFRVGGKIGVNIFLLISGYFLIYSKFSFKKFIKLVLQTIFYSIFITIIAISFFGKDLSNNDFIKVLLPICSNTYWFISTYCILYILSPFLNKFILGLAINQYNKLLIVLFIILSVIPSVLSNYYYDINQMGNNLILFIYIYLIGAYIRIYKEKIKIKKSSLKYYFIFSYMSIAVLMYFLILQKSKFTIVSEANYLLILICSVSLFLIFLDLKLYSVIINNISRTMFGIYLLHDHFLARSIIWKNIFKSQNFYKLNYMVLHMIVSCLIIFLFGVIIDYLRIRLLEDNIFKYKKIDILAEKVDKLMNLEE